MTHIPDDKPLTAGDLRTILSDRASLKKNGHSWGQYVGKWVTPQNICIAGLAVFTVGTRVQEVQTGITAALTASRAAMAATEAQDKLARQLSVRGRIVDRQLDEIQDRQDHYATKADVATVKDLLRLAVSRREWRESLDAQQQIIQRLARIESSVKGLP